MKTNIIDNSNFPKRDVASVKPANSGLRGISHFLTLECGHVVAVKKGHEVPKVAPCMRCDEEAKAQQG